MLQGDHAEVSFLDARYEHHASKNQDIRRHTLHTGPIEKCTAKIHGAKIDGTRCSDIGVAWTKVRGGWHFTFSHVVLNNTLVLVVVGHAT